LPPLLLGVRLCDLFDLDGIVNDEVHELIKSLSCEADVSDVYAIVPSRAQDIYAIGAIYPDFSFNSDGQLLVQPDLDGCMRLEQLEDEIDRREQDLAPTATASSHLGPWFR